VLYFQLIPNPTTIMAATVFCLRKSPIPLTRTPYFVWQPCQLHRAIVVGFDKKSSHGAGEPGVAPFGVPSRANRTE